MLLCLATLMSPCVMNLPRSFFSFEKESNFLRRDFLLLRISVGEERVTMNISACCTLNKHWLPKFISIQNKLHFSLLHWLSFPSKCSCLFLSSKNRADKFNRRVLLVCLSSPLCLMAVHERQTHACVSEKNMKRKGNKQCRRIKQTHLNT